jgi:hypothetical protein
VRHEHSATGGVGAPSLATADVPGVAHHELEVIVLVDGGGEVGVVLTELLHGHLAILVCALKGAEELTEKAVRSGQSEWRQEGSLEDLIARSFASDDIWMLAGVVFAFDVVQLDHSRFVTVKDLQSRSQARR